ncbi:MAG: pirin family protein [Betaproteobacteria bacterium]|nr:pirin family protein [Betaproteobacteria bacterium]
MIELVVPQRRRDLGGFEVGRVLPYSGGRMVGPFIFFDHMGPADFPRGIPRTMDVRPHPHIGLSTVTYLFEGEIMHRDSVGSEQPIRPGEVNWMVAGRGITHSERFERARREGGRLHGIQAWVALPENDEECEPAFFHHGIEDLPSFDGKGARGRLIAGEAHGKRASVKTHSPIFYVHWDLDQGAQIDLPDGYSERAVYVVSGLLKVDGRELKPGKMAVFRPGEKISAVTAKEPGIAMTLGGEPLGKRHIEWNFVSSRKERIEQAKADWRTGRMKLPDLDHDEFIPLPGDPVPPANPMS